MDKRGRALGLSIAVALASLGCSSAPASPDPAAGLVVGVTQQGGEQIARADGTALLSEAYTIYPDGRVVILENYGGTPAQRRGTATPDEARKLYRILRSDAWRALPEEREAADALEEVKFTVDTEGKTVSRSAATGEPVFREVLETLQAIRRRGG